MDYLICYPQNLVSWYGEFEKEKIIIIIIIVGKCSRMGVWYIGYSYVNFWKEAKQRNMVLKKEEKPCGIRHQQYFWGPSKSEALGGCLFLLLSGVALTAGELKREGVRSRINSEFWKGLYWTVGVINRVPLNSND